MRALMCRQLGAVEDLAIEDIADPLPGPGEVVIDVNAAALNFPDTLIIAGKYQIRPELPFVPGGEGAGVVSAVGEGVDQFAVGDRVMAVGATGAFAEKMLKPAAELVQMPASMDFATAAAFPVPV